MRRKNIFAIRIEDPVKNKKWITKLTARELKQIECFLEKNLDYFDIEYDKKIKRRMFYKFAKSKLRINDRQKRGVLINTYNTDIGILNFMTYIIQYMNRRKNELSILEQLFGVF